MLFQLRPKIVSRIEVRALWWPLQYLDFVVFKYAWGHCRFGKTHSQPSFNFLTDVLRSCFNISTLFSYLMLPSILWSAPVPPAAKHPHNMMLPPPCHTVGMVFYGILASPFYFKHNDSHYGQTIIFLFHQTRGHFSKSTIFVPMCSCNRSLAF